MGKVHQECYPGVFAVLLMIVAVPVARSVTTSTPPMTVDQDGLPAAIPEVRDHCAVDVFDQTAPLPSNDLQFTKELNIVEYVVNGNFKSLHCCAKGYTSIEWFKDGCSTGQPWCTAMSTFILYPEAANQTFYSKRVVPADAGNYTCIVRNDTHSYNHTVELKVIDAESYVGTPLPTYKLPDEKFIALGKPARLFCEAFVGSIDLPDAASEINWRRLGRNDSFIADRKRFSQRSVYRENNQVLGSYLTIDTVEVEDLGLYECRVSNAGDQVTQLTMWLREARYAKDDFDRPKAWRMFAIISGFLLFSVVTATILRNRLALVFLYFRNKVAITDQYDGKDFDVLLAYLNRDESFAAEISSTLQHSYGYQCLAFEIPAAPLCEWEAELRSAGNKCRRLLVIIQPPLLEYLLGLSIDLHHIEQSDGVARWQKDPVALLLKQIAKLHPSPVGISLQAMPFGYNDGEELGTLFPVAVPVIEWNQKRALWFKNWSLLRLRLPPRNAKHGAFSKPSNPTSCTVAVARARSSDSGSRAIVTCVVPGVNGSGNCGLRRLTTSSSDSLEILV